MSQEAFRQAIINESADGLVLKSKIRKLTREHAAKHAAILKVGPYVVQVVDYLASLESDGPIEPVAITSGTKLGDFAEPMQAAADLVGEPIYTTYYSYPGTFYAFVPGGDVNDFYEFAQSNPEPVPAAS